MLRTRLGLRTLQLLPLPGPPTPTLECVAQKRGARQLRSLAAASVAVLPFGLAFLCVSIVAPESDAVFVATLGVGAVGSGILDRVGNDVTEGWEKAYPPRRDLGLLLWLFDEWGHRPIRFAAHRLDAPVRRWVAAHYASVGVLSAGLVVLVVRIVIQR